MDSPSERPSGRPRTIDPDRVSLVALRLFDERGFDAVSMDDVAAAADVSRRSLFRLFPSKAALVWGGLEEAVDRFRARLASTEAGDDLWGAIRSAFLAAASIPDEMLEVTRHRLHVIRENPTLATVGSSTIGALTDAVVEFAAEHDASSADDLSTVVRAQALSGASTAALFWWAFHGGDQPPADVVRRAFELMAFDD
ncbi:TetR family transcriptional regulator [Microbacterium oleivorans]|uniref:Transcriptional regulator n=1 Tax=Microbacterium oleivorans TaxID=273677 RepID=A0A031FY91_9MICO|nr:TetR family transcriptional regulator [Microbacterium oleivorans]EZP29222.1 Transcriptional regulator [Microbacterium oleivorans]